MHLVRLARHSDAHGTLVRLRDVRCSDDLARSARPDMSTLPNALPDFARLRGIGGNHSGRLSRRIGQVLVEKGCSEWFDSRRLHHNFRSFGQVSADAATTRAGRCARTHRRAPPTLTPCSGNSPLTTMHSAKALQFGSVRQPRLPVARSRVVGRLIDDNYRRRPAVLIDADRTYVAR